jgi:hypothetical protein
MVTIQALGVGPYHGSTHLCLALPIRRPPPILAYVLHIGTGNLKKEKEKGGEGNGKREEKREEKERKEKEKTHST